VVDAELDSSPQNGERSLAIGRRPKHAGTRELHRPEPDAPHRAPRQRDGLVRYRGHGGQATPARTLI